MKMLIFPILFVILFYFIYKVFYKKQGKKNKIPHKKVLIAIILIIIGLLGFLSYKFYLSIIQPDTYCLVTHKTTSLPPKNLINAEDYFNRGNYNYDIGNCKMAVADYTKSIELDANRPETFNNRAYTYMRMQNYKDAVADLNKAIELRPNYVNALINRGDIYNFYYQIDHAKAIALYNKVISLGATKGNSVCGHKAMAMSNNVIPLAFLRIFTNVDCK